MSHHSQIVSQQVFGSSKKLQLVNSSPTQKQQSMSIEALLDSNGDLSTSTSNSRNDLSISALTSTSSTSSSSSSTPPPMSSKRRWNDSETSDNNERMTKLRKQETYPAYQPMTTIKCLHAAVAQKSYGSEKRFLCPPPVVSLQSNRYVDRHAHEISMAIVCENGERPLEQRVILDETLSGSFKFLHVTGTAKAKQFCLRVSLNLTTQREEEQQPYATFLSHPISIISKPSKKTAKARNVSSCILANAPISLFNRINSQTVRTKYLTSADDRMCAKNATWSPFDIVLVRPPMHGAAASSSTSSSSVHPAAASMPVTYGTELMLRDHNTGVTSPLLIIRKVDKGRIAPCAFGPVSQMQKVALQLASTGGKNKPSSKPMYLSAAGATMDGINSEAGGESGGHTSSSWIDFVESRIVRAERPSLELAYEEVDDYLCWTIVGIAQFEYSFFEPELQQQQQAAAELSSETSSPYNPQQTATSSSRRCITPFPVLSSVLYQPASHSIDVFGEHLIQAAPEPRILECWLGPHGPLAARHVSSQPEQAGSARHSTHVTVELPTAMALLSSANSSNANNSTGHPSTAMIPQPGNVRRLELPLLFARQDGVVYHSGKAIEFSIWSVLREDNNSNDPQHAAAAAATTTASDLAQAVKVLDCRA
ncbi:hypothetical protein BDB00DRAFT_838134 [Zychaea mexicana]|uniref:uncharacterized protein n=1 Tax=Zychaea mexicana TaxID=64656 RepID=UPI0022FF02F4|nr:uncharacterized protein BDB00DRAFT_838134 [Zychaea mexicana]KAI9490349.1 hypothetical protein BDB00DRAFT_838134 [Zychaea mexicana]